MDTNENTKSDTLTCVICEHKIEPNPITGWAYGHNADLSLIHISGGVQWKVN